MLLASVIFLSCSNDHKDVENLKEKLNANVDSAKAEIHRMPDSTLELTQFNLIKSDSTALKLYILLEEEAKIRDEIKTAENAKESRERRLAKLDTLPSGKIVMNLTVKELKEVKNGIAENVQLRNHIDSLIANSVGLGASENDTIAVELTTRNKIRK